MEILVLGAVCLYSVSACIWVAWKELIISREYIRIMYFVWHMKMYMHD